MVISNRFVWHACPTCVTAEGLCLTRSCPCWQLTLEDVQPLSSVPDKLKKGVDEVSVLASSLLFILPGVNPSCPSLSVVSNSSSIAVSPRYVAHLGSCDACTGLWVCVADNVHCRVCRIVSKCTGGARARWTAHRIFEICSRAFRVVATIRHRYVC